MRPDGPRDPIIGSDAGPEPPFPLRMGGKVVSGFGRGSKDLGIPTANIPVEGVPWIEEAKSGVYFGWAGIKLPDEHAQLNPEAEGTVKPSAAFTTSAPPLCPVSPPKEAAEKGWRLFPMVMSIGYNPFYRNTVRSAEVHVMRGFEKDFYGCEMKISILGWIREEYDYVSREALVDDIRMDIEVAGKSLERKAWGDRAQDPYLWGEGADFPSSKAQKI